ncbi:MAG: PilT/PilU family type 4a pilus ATPase [Candidatus Marinimicrobia bacterium]|nr:PilT/PilU family type 4a pilus ATPase [Candidatus Neomarinimicrobiota bacterium]MBL7046658.1 PilT/PilU family type 4a pilus ATPase [Candidatus Neomarinimicrobiota bacterium]
MYTIKDLLSVMVEANASDLFIVPGAYPMLKISGETVPLEKEIVTPDIIGSLKEDMLDEKQRQAFAQNHELDFTYSLSGVGRFRVNFFRQRNSDSFVIRRIISQIKTFDELNLPPLLGDLVLKERGLVLVVGATGSGKSTTLAAMVEYRNTNLSGHILALEDPIEYLHTHKKSIVSQREIGQDTDSFSSALRSALREAPSMLLIGEIRDQTTMSAALNFAETGHLVLSTIHATNAYQTIERIESFYDAPQHQMIRLQLSQNLMAIVAQRLIPTVDGKRRASMEILLSTARIQDLIHKGEIDLLRHTIESSTAEGMQLFDQSLYKLYKEGVITDETAIQFADRPNDLRLLIRSKEEQMYTQKIELSEDED